MPTGDPFCENCRSFFPCRCRRREIVQSENVATYEPFIDYAADGLDEAITVGRTQTAIDPAHYKELSPEPIDVIDSWGLEFYEAQVLKYIARAGRKGGEAKRLEDLEKAAWYLQRRINRLKAIS